MFKKYYQNSFNSLLKNRKNFSEEENRKFLKDLRKKQQELLTEPREGWEEEIINRKKVRIEDLGEYFSGTDGVQFHKRP